MGSAASLRRTDRLAPVGLRLKLAVTEWAALMVSWQAPLPEQSKPQVTKTELPEGAGVRVTTVPSLNVAEQGDAPHEMPGGLLVTVPLPEPVKLTLNVY